MGFVINVKVLEKEKFTNIEAMLLTEGPAMMNRTYPQDERSSPAQDNTVQQTVHRPSWQRDTKETLQRLLKKNLYITLTISSGPPKLRTMRPSISLETMLFPLSKKTHKATPRTKSAGERTAAPCNQTLTRSSTTVVMAVPVCFALTLSVTSVPAVNLTPSPS